MLEKIDNLTTENNRSFYIDKSKLQNMKLELEGFLKDESNMNNIDFSKRVMRSQEIKTNNTIEGYIDDVSSIEKTIKESKKETDTEEKRRILNLYKGYRYILKQRPIDKTSLKHLYSLLSKDLLDEQDLHKMGNYYRNDDVFIFYSANTSVLPDKGIDCHLLEEKMSNLFEFSNNNNDIDSMTDYYIKSQIAHLYFVYLHPYFDINGRTARTTAMWYLLNNEAYPYTIFNRAINNTKSKYYKEIRMAKETRNMTNFIYYLMLETKKELEKEYVLMQIKDSTKYQVSSMESVALLYILSMKGEKTLKDLVYLYNKKNHKKRVEDFYNEMIQPLLEKEIIYKTRNTNSKYNGEDNNFCFELNKDNLYIDSKKIKRIKV